MVAAPVAPLQPSSTAAEVGEKATKSRQEATMTSTRNDRESIPSTMPPPPSSSSSSSSLAPNQRVRVRGVPATVRYVGPVANKDPADTWIGLEWDDDNGSSEGGRGKHDGSVGGVRYFQTRRRRRPSSSSPVAPPPPPPALTGSLVRAAALDAPGVLVVGCSVEEALVRRYRGCYCAAAVESGNGENDNGSATTAAAASSSFSASSSFVAGHEEVAARLAKIHELEVASVAGSPAAFCLEEGGLGGGGQGGGRNEAKSLLPLRELAPGLRALDAAGCLFSEWREIEKVLRALPGLQRLDLTRCGGLAAAEAGAEAAVVAVEGEEEGEKDDKSSSSSSSLAPPRPLLPKSPPSFHGLRELVLAETGAEWGTVLSALAASGVTGLRALSLRRCGLRGFGGGGGGAGGGGGGGDGGGLAGRKGRELHLLASVCSRLEELDLSENDLSCWRRRGSEAGEGGEEGIGEGIGIAEELGALPFLSTLDLSRNRGLASLSSSFAAVSSESSSSSSPSPPFAALKELRLAECGFSSWAELECLFEEAEEEEAAAPAAEEKKKNGDDTLLLPSPFPRLSSLRLSGNPLPAPDPTTGCGRADVVARLREGVSSLNGARVGPRERADARRALEAARSRSRGAAGKDRGASSSLLAGLSLGGGEGGGDSSSSRPPPPSSSSTGIMAPMAASMLELRIVLSGEEEEEEEPPSSSSSASAATASGAAAAAKAAAATNAKARRPPVRLPGSTTVTRLRQLAARLTGVPAREQVLRVEMGGGGGGGGERRGEGGGGGGCAAAAPAAAAAGDGDGDGDNSGSAAVVLLELTPADDSRDLRFLGVSSGSVVRVSRR